MIAKYTSKPDAILLLEDGKIFRGKAAGKIGTTTGELAFNTGMTGYQEVFTDPSYYGQLLITTNVHIGNYGIAAEEVESNSIKIAGLICKKFNEYPSRARSQKNIKDYFVEQNVVGISDVDTRALVRYIRDKGAMNAVISSDESNIDKLKEVLKKVPSMQGLELSSKVTTKQSYFVGHPESTYKVAVIDFGVKTNILRSLASRDCYLQVFPMKTPLDEILKFKPDGFMMTNGPGDPSVMNDEIKLVKSAIDTGIPVFGICLGHQIIAHANGINTFKMHKGHRGINHPVKNLLTGKCEVTSQNHGFSVKAEDVSKNPELEITHINLNDNTVEGLRMKTKNVFSVQYHPEASPGPHDSRYLFDEFVQMMGRVKAGKKAKELA